MITLLGNLLILGFPIISFLPQLIKRKPTIPPTIAVLTVLSSFLRVCYFFMHYKNVGSLSIVFLFSPMLSIILYSWVLKSKNKKMSVLEERIQIFMKSYYKEMGLKSFILSSATAIFALGMFITIFVKNMFVMTIFAWTATYLEILCLLLQIAIIKVENDSVVNISTFKVSSFKNNTISEYFNYKVNVFASFCKFLWLLYLKSPMSYLYSTFATLALHFYILKVSMKSNK